MERCSSPSKSLFKDLPQGRGVQASVQITLIVTLNLNFIRFTFQVWFRAQFNKQHSSRVHISDFISTRGHTFAAQDWTIPMAGNRSWLGGETGITLNYCPKELRLKKNIAKNSATISTRDIKTYTFYFQPFEAGLNLVASESFGTDGLCPNLCIYVHSVLRPSHKQDPPYILLKSRRAGTFFVQN